MEQVNISLIEHLSWSSIHGPGSAEAEGKRITIRDKNGEIIEIIITKKLGGGENGVTYETTSGQALKIVNLNKDNRKIVEFTRESQLQNNIAMLKNGDNPIAPKVYGYYPIYSTTKTNFGYLLMDKINPISKDELSETVYSGDIMAVKQLIECIAISIYNGYVHNDLHAGNIAKDMSGNFILIDFGFTQNIGGFLKTPFVSGQPIISNNPRRVLFNQVLIAQLYALTEHCNGNNYDVDCRGAPLCNKDTIRSIYAVSGAVDKKILEALNAGDFKTAIKYLGCESGTEDDLLNIVSKNLKLDSVIISNIANQCASAIMDVIYDLRKDDLTTTDSDEINWYSFAQRQTGSQQLTLRDSSGSGSGLRPGKRRREGTGGGKTRIVNKLSIQNLKPRRSKNKRSQKSSKKRSQKAGGIRRSFKSQRRKSPKFNKKK